MTFKCVISWLVIAQEGAGHPNVKDSRALWLGDLDYVLTSGFDSVSITLSSTFQRLNNVYKLTYVV